MSSHTQTKPSVSHPLCLASLLCLGSTVAMPAQEDHHLGVRGAVEVEFEAERGHSYRLQRSTDLVHWEDVGEEVYGHGRREDRLLSARERKSGGLEVFRVVAREASTEGPAPWVLTGVVLNLDHAPGGDVIRFLSETDGVDQGEAPDPFTYQYTRLGTHEAKVEITYARSKVDVLGLTFTTSSAGTWVRDEYRKGRLKDRDTGVFAVLDANGAPLPATGGGTEPPPKVPAEVPATLGGLAYTFRSGETPERLEFPTTTAGTEFGDDPDDDEPKTFTYAYTLATGNTAALVVTFKPDRRDEYDLNYTGPAQGSFVRREFRNGKLKDTDHGAFSAVQLPQDGGNPPGDDSGAMPTDTLSGLSYVMNDGGDILTQLDFPSASAGTQLDDSAPTQFTYTYTVTGALTARLVLRFKADKWEEYDLTFQAGANTGTFVRREFDRNVLKDTDTGSFRGGPRTP